MDTVTADALTLMDQAPMTVSGYMAEAEERIDRRFGEGYAKKHPELVGAFIRACAEDFNTSILLWSAQEIVKTLGEVFDQLSVSVEMEREDRTDQEDL